MKGWLERGGIAATLVCVLIVLALEWRSYSAEVEERSSLATSELETQTRQVAEKVGQVIRGLEDQTRSLQGRLDAGESEAKALQTFADTAPGISAVAAFDEVTVVPPPPELAGTTAGTTAEDSDAASPSPPAETEGERVVPVSPPEPVYRGTAVGLERTETGELLPTKLTAGAYRSAPWYLASSRGLEGWSDPIWDETAREMVLRYSLPLKTAAGQPARSLIVELPLDFVEHQIEHDRLGRSGYGVLLNEKGRFLYHPLSALVQSEKSVFSRIEEGGRTDLEKRLQRLLKSGTAGHVELGVSSESGRETWAFFHPVERSGWVFSIVVFADDFTHRTQGLYRAELRAWLFSSAALLLVLLGLSTFVRSKRRRLLVAMGSVTLCLSLATALIWWRALAHPPELNTDLTPVASKSEAFSLLRKHRQLESGRTLVYTGVRVASLEIAKGNVVNMTGYCWQRYPDGVPEGSEPGFVAPDHIGVRSGFTEAYKLKEEGEAEEIYGYRFRLQLRLPFDYTRYPYDEHELRLRLWHQDFGRRALLLPDFRSYDIINPLSKPGIDPHLVMPGWSVMESSFGYAQATGAGSYGLTSLSDAGYPELVFRARVQRDFLNGLLNTLVRPVVVSILLFALLLLMRKNEDLKFLGFSASGVIGTGGGFMLFVLAGDQRSLRESISAVGITYAEYFYFALYVLIVLFAANALIFTQTSRLTWIEYEDNLGAKAVYWPLLLLLIFGATMLCFY